MATAEERELGCSIAYELRDLAHASFAAIYVVGPKRALTLLGETAPTALRPAKGVPALVHRGFAAAEPVPADEAELIELRGPPKPCETAVAAPLVFEGKRVGVLLLGLESELERAERDAVSGLGRLAAAALVNARRFSLTFDEARRDPLTGLANSRAFREELDRLLGAADEGGGEVTLAILDLDDFKAINDSQGHPAGDRVLRQVARVALRSVRAGEEVFRVGGDEFAVVLQGGRVAGSAVVSRIQRSAADHSRRLRLPTVSAGIASYPADANTRDSLVECADRAMYAAKGKGRGGVTVYGREPRRGKRETAA